MRKLLVIGVLALIAAAAFAQDAPKNNEIYGTVWLDYDASGARFDNTAPFSTTASDFSFSRYRFGLRNTLADGVKSWFEFDPRNLEFRQVNVDWSPIANLDLIAGKQSKLFAQNNDWIFGDRTLGIQARYALRGSAGRASSWATMPTSRTSQARSSDGKEPTPPQSPTQPRASSKSTPVS